MLHIVSRSEPGNLALEVSRGLQTEGPVWDCAQSLGKGTPSAQAPPLVRPVHILRKLELSRSRPHMGHGTCLSLVEAPGVALPPAQEPILVRPGSGWSGSRAEGGFSVRV